MTLEDFTTYTETDPNSHITVAANHIDAYGYNNEDARVHKDFGAAHFGNFTHLVDVKCVELGTSGDRFYCWVMANAVNDIYDLYLANEDFIFLWFYRTGAGSTRLYMEEILNQVEYQDYYVISLNTWYYLKIEKNGTALTCKIYSDAARTALLDTLSLTLHSNYTFQYLYPFNSIDLDEAQSSQGYVDNLDIGEAAITQISVSGQTLLSGAINRNKAFSVSGLVTLSGSIAIGEPLQKYVSGSVEGLGSILTSKVLAVYGTVDGHGVVVVDTGEILVFHKGKLEDIFH